LTNGSLILVHGKIAERYRRLTGASRPKLRTASPTSPKPSNTFTIVHLYSAGLTHVRIHWPITRNKVPPINAKPAGLVTMPVPGLGNIALAKMSPAVKSRATVLRLGTS
jgi:hypothetical protein